MKKLATTSSLVIVALLGITSYFALVVAPTEATMGNVQRIFYYHVSSGWVGMLCFFVNFVASIVYLWKRSPRSDALAEASAEVGVVFCAVLLLLGTLWAKPVWGIWWTWDARLTTTLVLWLIYVSYLVLRKFSAGGQTQVLAAAFAVFGFADVPIVYMSIRWFRTQHPAPVIGGGEGSGMAPAIWHVFLLSLIAFTLMGAMFVWLRYNLALQQQTLESAHAQAALKGVA
jgi:heme exporter protein C